MTMTTGETERRRPPRAKLSPSPKVTQAVTAPVEFFERLDRWRLAHPQQPNRQAAIRGIVHRFLLREEAKVAKAGAKAKARQRRVRRSK